MESQTACLKGHNVGAMSSSGNPSHGIGSLPPEVLLMVFWAVFYGQASGLSFWELLLNNHGPDKCKGPGCSCRFAHGMWHEISNVRSQDLFPYSLCRVSPHWDAVMAREPEFWTRPIVFLDTTKYDPVARLRVELDRARGLPLSIYVDTINDNSYENTAFGEDHRRLEQLASILPSIANRLHGGHIHGPTTGQLARLVASLCDSQEMLKLKHLSLGPSPGCVVPPSLSSPLLNVIPSFEALNYLHLSGLSVKWLQDNVFKNLELTRLTISNVSKRHGHHHHLKIPQLLSSIASYVESECTGLTFQDIDLPGDFNGGFPVLPPVGYATTLEFTRVCAPFLDAFFGSFCSSRTVFIEDQTIDDCPLDECSVRFADSCNLSLINIHNPKALFVFFHLASAQTMTVSNCQSLDDHALQALSKVGSATAELPCMHGLYGLEISGCPVSFAGLQNMVAGRRRNAEALNVPFEEDHFDPYNHENPPIMSLDITQDDLYRFSDAEQTWLNDNVKSFHYRRHRLQIPA